MIKKTWLLVMVVAGAVACSGGGSASFTDPNAITGGDDGGSGSSSGSGSGSSGDGTGSSGGGPGSGSTSPGDDGGTLVKPLYDSGLPDASLDAPIILTMDTFTVGPNEEVFKCQQFGNPFGKDTDIVKMDGYMTAGSHHFFLFNMDASTGRTAKAGIGDCPGGGKEFHPFPYLSQTAGHYIVNYPQEDMGYPLVSANGLMMNAHYLNTSSMPITPKVQITIYPAKAGVVKTHVGSIFLNNTFFSVPPISKAAPQWFSKSTAPIKAEDYTIMTNWSHMHQWSVDFQAIANGTTFYEETQWEEPKLITQGTGVNTSPMLPMKMKAGTSIQWQCKYYNDTGATLSFGDSARSNVMCIYIGQYYPADKTQPSYPDVVAVLN